MSFSTKSFHVKELNFHIKEHLKKTNIFLTVIEIEIFQMFLKFLKMNAILLQVKMNEKCPPLQAMSAD